MRPKTVAERWARNKIKKGVFPRWVFVTGNNGKLERRFGPIMTKDEKGKWHKSGEYSKRSFRMMCGMKLFAETYEGAES